MLKVKFMPGGEETTVDAGTTLLEAAGAIGVHIDNDCAGRGTCGKCRVRLTAGGKGEVHSAEREHLSPGELEQGWVLACCRPVEEDSVVEVPLRPRESDRKTGLAAPALEVAAAPAIEKHFLRLAPPEITDQSADLERLLEGLARPNLAIETRELATLPSTLRKNDFSVTAVVSGERIITVEGGDTSSHCYGIAFDIGTTTLMGSLLDLRTAEVLARTGTTNPQNAYGADVISRINHAARGANERLQLQKAVISAANTIIDELLKQTALPREQIYEAVAVGNTTMSHLFMGIDPTNLGPAPFIPAFSQALEVAASSLELSIHPSGRFMFLPGISGYVGSDTLGMILATGLDRRLDNCLAIDIGTNGELVLATGGRLTTCSTAAGPAFEGAQITRGMRAAPGAIEVVEYNEGELQLETIDGAPACGICGSGLIDIAAALLEAGLIEPTGRFSASPGPGKTDPCALGRRIRKGRQGLEFLLVPGEEAANGEDIVLTQGDLRELQLAKGAIYAGLSILLKEAGIGEGDLDEVLLAGAFGSYIRKESALRIGLLPKLPPEKIKPVGNAAGDGAIMALASTAERNRALDLPAEIRHLELSTRRDFQDIFIEALSFDRRTREG